MDILKDLLEQQETAKADVVVVDPVNPNVEDKVDVNTPADVVTINDLDTNDKGNEEGDDEGNESDVDEAVVAEIIRFKELVEFEGDLEDFSVDSIAKVVNAKVEKEKEAIVNIIADEDVKALLDWKQKGYNLESFLQAPQVFNKEVYTIDKDGDAVISHVYKNLKGLNDDDVTSMLDVLNLDPAKKQAKFEEFTTLLETESKKEYDAFIASQQEVVDKKKAELKEIQTTIETGALGYVNITDVAERTSFKKYLESTEVEKKWKSLTPQQVATIEYLIFKDFNVDGLKKVVTPSKDDVAKRKPIQITHITNKKSIPSDVKQEQEALLNKFLNK